MNDCEDANEQLKKIGVEFSNVVQLIQEVYDRIDFCDPFTVAHVTGVLMDIKTDWLQDTHDRLSKCLLAVESVRGIQ